MSVSCPIAFLPLTDDERRPIDFETMRHAFAAHNELGRLCDEVIYKNDLLVRLKAAGLTAQAEVPVTVEWRGFRKTYFLDLVVADALLYELKTVTALSPEHRAQLLNYILLLGLPSGKLVNFRTGKVESAFLATRLTPATRCDIHFDGTRFRAMSDACAGFHRDAGEMLRTLGAFLALELYQEALTWACGGEMQTNHPIEMTRDGIALGQQRCSLIAPGVAFHITAHTSQFDPIESNLLRFLHHTNLRAMHWLNLNHSHITLTTLSPRSV